MAEPPAERWSTLALWHPDGIAPQALVIGGGCPPKLLTHSADPERDSQVADRRADLVVVCPGPRQRRERGWLAAALRTASAALAVDGVLFVMLPAASRRRAEALIRAQGLELVARVAHLPQLETSRYLVPVGASSLRYALGRLIPTYPRARRLAHALLGARGVGPVVASLLPSVALIGRLPAARPLLAWMAPLQGDAGAAAVDLGERVIAVTSWRAQGGPTVLHVLAAGEERASVVMKVPGRRADCAGLELEEANLRRLGPSARDAGARVPTARLARLGDDRPVLVQSAVAGRPLAGVIADRPRALGEILEQVSDWIARWNRATVRAEPLDRASLDRLLLRPAALVTPLVADGEDYRRWLQARAAIVAGTKVPLTACHHDLAMRNLLVDDAGSLGVVDWETSEERGLPLGDLIYACVDAVGVATGCAERVDAFAQCFAANGAWMPVVRDLMARSARELALSPELIELAFHACWLRHAANERQARAESGRGPFLVLVDRLARERDRLGRMWSA